VSDGVSGGIRTFGAVEFKSMPQCSDDYKIVERASPRLIGVDTIVSAVPRNHVGYAYCSAKPLNTIVLIGYDFAVVGTPSVSHSTGRKAFDFIARSGVGSPVTN